MFQRRGVTNIELFGHTGFPATTVNTTLNQAAAAGATAVRLAATANYLAGDTLRVDTGTNLESVTIASIITPAPASPEPNVTLTAPLTKAHAAGVAASYFNKRGLEEYRALLDKYGIHAGGEHGSVSENGWDDTVAAGKILGADYLGSGGTPAPGIGSYANVIATAETANRLGKYAVENGVGRVYIHNHQQEFRTRYVDNGVLKTAWQIYMERIDARYAAAEIDAFWASDAYDDVTGTAVAGLINQFPTKVRLLHIKDGANIAPRRTPLVDPLACGTPGEPACQNASPRTNGFAVPADRTAYDGLNFNPIFAAAAGRVQYYHHEHDGGTPNNANDSFINLRGINGRAVGTVLGAAGDLPVGRGRHRGRQQRGPGRAAEHRRRAAQHHRAGHPGRRARRRFGQRFRDREPELHRHPAGRLHARGRRPGHRRPTRRRTPPRVAPAPSTSASSPRARAPSPSRGFRSRPARTPRPSRSLLAGREHQQLPLGSVGGTVASMLSLTLGSTPSFGAFVPAVARTYDAARRGDRGQHRRRRDAVGLGRRHASTRASSSTARSRWPRRYGPRDQRRADQPGLRAGRRARRTTLLTYAAPTFGAESVTLGFRQAIGANDQLRAGNYSKTLTFTLSTTTP